MNNRNTIKPVPSKIYDKEYFLSPEKKGGLRGAHEFKNNRELIPAFKKAITYVSKKDQIILDVGCGRGELICYLAKKGKRTFGIDYAKSAIEISQKLKMSMPQSAQSRVSFIRASCTSLPFKNNYFDIVFMIDIVEHLTPEQLTQALKESYRVLKSRGNLVIHTNNYWFEKVGYWLIVASYRWFRVLRHKHEDIADHIHINYMSKSTLTNYLKNAGFDYKVEMTIPRDLSEMKRYLPYNNPLLGYVLHRIGFLLLKSPLQYFLAPTTWALAVK